MPQKSFADIISIYLNACLIKHNKDYVTKRIKTHPDYPKLTALTDTLDEFKILYTAAVVDKQNYNELPFPFLAHFQNEIKEDSEFVLVKNASSLEADSNSLLNKWDGILVKIDEKQSIQSDEHSKLLTREKGRKYLILLFVTLVVLSLLLPVNKFPFLLLQLFSIAGTFLSAMIFIQKLNIANSVPVILCNSKTGTNCNAILGGKKGRIYNIFYLDDLALVYFSTSCLYFLYNSVKGTNYAAFSFYLFPASLSTLLTISLLVYQIITKNLCKICITLASITIAQGLSLYYLLGPTTDFSNFTNQALIFFIISSIITLSLVQMKQFLVRAQSSEIDQLIPAQTDHLFCWRKIA